MNLFAAMIMALAVAILVVDLPRAVEEHTTGLRIAHTFMTICAFLALAGMGIYIYGGSNV